MDAERTLLNFQLEEVEARTRREIILADLSLSIAGMRRKTRQFCGLRRTTLLQQPRRGIPNTDFVMTKSLSLLLLITTVGARCSSQVAPKARRMAARPKRRDTLHLRDAPAGDSGSSRQLPHLRHEADAVRKQTVLKPRAVPQRPAWRTQNQILQIHHDPGEVRQTPGKDSMGMDMVPVYEDEAAANESQTIAIDPVTIQNMDIRTATVRPRPVAPDHPHRRRH